MKSVIYSIRNIITNKIYVGSSINYKNRWYRHKSHLRKHKHDNIHLQRAWDKYGEDNFKFEVLEYVDNGDLLVKEQFYIDKLKSCDIKYGYNINHIAGAPPSWMGRHLTKEHKEKIRVANSGHYVSPETREKISLAHIGKLKPRTKEWQEHINTAKKGFTHTEETKEKIRNKILNTKLSEETKRKISESNKGRISANKDKRFSDITKQRMSNSQRVAWGRRKGAKI